MPELLQTESVMLSKTLMDANAEYVLSGDFMLPDYCPDVAMVLTCVVTPYIQSRRYSGDLLTLEGVAAVRVLYLDDERRCVRVAEFTQPMSCSVRGQSGCEGVPVSVRAHTEYIHCRAVSPRRVEVRGALVFSVYASGADMVELPVAAMDERLCVRRSRRTVCAPLVSAEKTVAVTELLNFDSTLPAAEQLLGGDCHAVVSDCKLLTDKAIVKGQLYIHHLYTDDSLTGAVHALDYTIPFSLIMDVDGARDGMLHSVEVSVLQDTQECVGGENGSNTALDFTSKLLVQLCVYDSVEMEWLTDAFHRDCPVSLSTRALCVRSLCGVAYPLLTIQKRVSLPNDELQGVLDVWVTPTRTNGCVQDGRVEVVSQVTIGVLARDVDGLVMLYERPEELRWELPSVEACDADEVQACVSVCCVSYTANGDTLDLRISAAADVRLWQTVEQAVVSDLSLKSDAAYSADVAALRLYYADAGESVWEIARHCHVSPACICEENGLTGDMVNAKTVLLVPAE